MGGTQFNPLQRGNLAKFTVSHKRKCRQHPQTPQSHSPVPWLTCAAAHLRCGSPALWLRCTQAAAALVCATCAPERPARSSVLRADRCVWSPHGRPPEPVLSPAPRTPVGTGAPFHREPLASSPPALLSAPPCIRVAPCWTWGRPSHRRSQPLRAKALSHRLVVSRLPS